MAALRCPACDSVNVHTSGLSGEAVCEDCGTLVDDTGALLVHRQLDEDASTFFAGTQRLGRDGRTAVGGAPRGKGVQQSQINKERREVRPFAS
jgi:transcription initiation factor TFIIIB Brf1 subunit/transcription initiation factor TFIIB